MSVHALRARSVSELVDATFSLYRRDASAYIMVTAIASIPGLVGQLLLLGGGASATAAFAGVISLVVSMITYALMTGVILRMGSDVYLGGEADVAGAVRAVMPRVGTLIAIAIGKSILYFLGALVFLVGFLYAFARWFAPEAVAILEQKDFGEAFARCSQLSAGRKWHIFKALFLGYAIYFLLMVGVIAVATAFGSETLSLVVQSLFMVVAYPIVGLLTMLLYYDARIRGEGFDVEHLSRTLAAPPAR